MLTETLLQSGRVTRHLPWLRGVELIRRGYKQVLHRPAAWKMRINDFDGDIKMDVDPREFLGVTLWHKPELFERRERQIFCDCIRPGSVVLDLGANIGVYSLMAAKRGAKVFAVEADPENAIRLKHHVDLNGFKEKIKVFEIAAWDREDTVTIFHNPDNCGGTSCYDGINGVPVPARAIDQLELPAIDLCKIDIEGSESVALLGMIETLKRSPNVTLCVEYNPKVGNCGLLMRMLHASFKNIQVIGGHTLPEGESPRGFCDLVCRELKSDFDWSFCRGQRQ